MKRHILPLIILLPVLVNAQVFPKKPTNYVTTYDPFYTSRSFLSKQEEARLNAKLKAFEDSTGRQLFVYVTSNLRGTNLEDHSRDIFNTWGIGQKEKNNGILIAIFINDRKYRIQVGYGLEAALPSELCKQIQDEHMQPFFKERKYYEGIQAGVDQLIFYSGRQYEAPGPFNKIWIPLVISVLTGLVFFIINFFSAKKWNNLPKRKQKYGILNLLFLLLPPIASVGLSLVNSIESSVLLMPIIIGALALLLLCVVINDKDELKYVNESDDAYERRMAMERDRDRSNDSSGDSFSGGGGGSSDRGGSSSSW